jgi:uncharacterized protein YggE
VRLVSAIRIATALAFGVTAASAAAQSTDTPKLLPGESVVRVEAEGSVTRVPDVVTISISIQSEGTTPAEATEANSAKLAKLIRDLASLGVDQASISASELAALPIHPEVNGNEDRSRIVGYRARQGIGVELPEVSRLQAVIGRLVQTGYGDLRASFRLSDEKLARAEAQRAAVANAKAEAENLASALGKRVGRLLLVGNNAEAYRGWDSYGQNIVVTASRMQPLVLTPAPVDVEAKVYVDWSLIDR